jgi:hypothetical protein
MTAMSVDSWINSRKQLYQDKFMQNALQEGLAREEAQAKAYNKQNRQ